MVRAPAPPRLALRLLELLLAPSVREFALGDLEEEFGTRVLPRRGPRAARRWFWRQALRCLVAGRPARARRGTRRRIATSTEAARTRKGDSTMRTFQQDLVFAVRVLRRQPGFAATAVLTLGLGIGANTAIFSIVHEALLAPLAYPEPERLVILRDSQVQSGLVNASWPELLDWRSRSAEFLEVGGFFNTVATLTGSGEAESLSVQRVSWNLLPILGVEPALGRGFIAEEEPQGSEAVTILSDGLWRRRFGADPGMLGRKIVLNDRPHIVVGVMAPGFAEILPGDASPSEPRDAWVPLRLDEEGAPRGLHFLAVIGRLAPGVTHEQARERLAAISAGLQAEAVTDHGLAMIPLAEYVSSASRPVLLALFGAVGAVLLVTCANLAGLLLARANARRQEIAVRLTLGAGPRRLVRQLLTEAVLLSALGGALGLALAWVALRWFAVYDSGWAEAPSAIAIDAPVLLFSIALSLLTGVVFGLVPALSTARSSPGVTLAEAGPRSGGGRTRSRALLVVAEVAAAVVLLVGAGLLTRSFGVLLSVEKGFRTDGTVSFHVSLRSGAYESPEAQTRFFDALLERLLDLPGVEIAGLTNELPLAGGGVSGGVTIVGETFSPDEQPYADKRIVSAGFFESMGMPIRRGRGFDERDREGAPAVMVVSESFARRYLDGDALGRHVGFGWDSADPQEVVGVVGDVRHEGLGGEPAPTMYIPYRQRADSSFTVVVRSATTEDALMPAIRAAVRELDPDQPITSLTTFDDVLARSVAPRRLALLLVGGFALVTLALAVIGIYGLISYATSQRTREIGVQIALGAGRRTVLSAVLRQGLALTAAGLAIGAALALAMGRVIAAYLYGVSPRDPATFLAAGALLTAVALAACYLPARRAARVDPVTALRE
jgi:putative ABC transport system permease protein